MDNDPFDNRLDRLFAAARKTECYESARAYGFETRVMARIRSNRAVQRPFLLWAWRTIPIFVSLVIFLGIWIYASEPHYMVDLSEVAKIGDEEAILTAFLAGE
ncbi:MAG: hypothetical protein ABSA46_05195 [Thermodesulfovibrionales bacterium]|jgi:hypothetical protein